MSKAFIITGAFGHIGFELCKILLEEGHFVIMTDNVECQHSNKSLQYLEQRGYENFLFSELDLTQPSKIVKFCSEIKKSFNEINGLVNLAAYTGSSKLENWDVKAYEQRSIVWSDVFQLNLFAIFDLCQHLYPILRISPGSSIVNISSIYAQFAPNWSLYKDTELTNPAGYGASKAGLEYLTKWLASSYAPNVRVNAIAPGGIYRGQSEVFVRKYNQKNYLGRMATEHEIVGPIRFLLSEEASYINGQILNVDGGWKN